MKSDIQLAASADVVFKKVKNGKWDVIKHRFDRPCQNVTDVQKGNIVKQAHMKKAQLDGLHISKVELKVVEL